MMPLIILIDLNRIEICFLRGKVLSYLAPHSLGMRSFYFFNTELFSTDYYL